MSDPRMTQEKRGHVGVLTLTRPTMPPIFFEEFEAAIRELSSDEEVRAVVVQSEAKAFSYGLDLKAAFAEHGQLFAGGGLAGEREKLRQFIKRLQQSFLALADCPVPVIAAIHGVCIGAGLDLVTACDIRLASADATLALRETKMAIVADLGSLQRLPRIVGSGHARELAFTGKDIDADRAVEIGLVNAVYPDRLATQQAAFELAEQIAKNSPIAVRGAKQVLLFSEEHSIAEGLDYVATWNSAFFASEDLGEAFAAFVGKREPSFKGR